MATYLYRAVHGNAGWWDVQWSLTGSSWETVARVFGQKRAEIVRDALSAEANERVS